MAAAAAYSSGRAVTADLASKYLQVAERFVAGLSNGSAAALEELSGDAVVYGAEGLEAYTALLCDQVEVFKDATYTVNQYRVGHNRRGDWIEYYFTRTWKDEDGIARTYDSRANFSAERMYFDEDGCVREVMAYDTRKIVDSRRTALVILDAQDGIVRSGPMAPNGDDPATAARFEACVDSIEKALNHARYVGMPIMHVKHVSIEGQSPNTPVGMYANEHGALRAGGADGRIINELAPLATEPVFTKSTINVFAGTSLAHHLRSCDINTVVLCGFVTHYAVYAACVGAADAGFNVAVLNDGCASGNQSRHDVCMDVMKMLATTLTAIDFTHTYH